MDLTGIKAAVAEVNLQTLPELANLLHGLIDRLGGLKISLFGKEFLAVEIPPRQVPQSK